MHVSEGGLHYCLQPSISIQPTKTRTEAGVWSVPVTSIRAKLLYMRFPHKVHSYCTSLKLPKNAGKDLNFAHEVNKVKKSYLDSRTPNF